MIPKISQKRFFLIHLAVLALFPLILFQIVRLTLERHDFLVSRAKLQHDLTIPIEPDRGLILSRHLKEFATNLRVPSIYAVPRGLETGEKHPLANRLSQLLDLPSDFVMGRLKRDKAFVWLKRHVTSEEADAIRALESPHLGVTYEPKRFYPNGRMLSQVIGFCNIDNVGVEGLELLHDESLRGIPGYRHTKRDARGREIVALEKQLVPPTNGASLMLTIDHHVQYLTDQALDRAITKRNAKRAVALVMDPNTGEILAMSSRHTFDPNARDQTAVERRRNKPLTDVFEPGSIFKIVTGSAALNEGAVSLGDRFDGEHGEWQVRRGRTIHDAHPYGLLTFSEVLIKSSNIGTVKIAQRLGEKRLYDYIRRFGFGAKTGIDFPGEVNGILRPVERWSKYSITSIPYGQEVAATSIQMVRAISAIANGGYLVRPYLIKEIRDHNGVALVTKEPVISGPILKPDVAAAMNRILERAVAEGTGTRAQVKGFRVAGKTGTSQKLEPNGQYSHSHFVGSFIGYAPADHPKLAMVVSIDDPKPYYYGGTVAAPVFQEVMEQALMYLGLIPTELNGKLDRFIVEANGAKPALLKSSQQKFQGAVPQVQ